MKRIRKTCSWMLIFVLLMSVFLIPLQKTVQAETTYKWGRYNVASNQTQTGGGQQICTNWDHRSSYDYATGTYKEWTVCTAYGYSPPTYSYTYYAGSFIDYVTSTSRYAYPDNNQSGSYWYKYEGVANTDPTGSIDQTSKSINLKASSNTFNLTGTARDTDAESLQVTATIGGIQKSQTLPANSTASGTAFNLSWTAQEIPAGNYTNIPVRITDPNGAVANLTYTGTLKVDKTPLVYYDKYQAQSGNRGVLVQENIQELDGTYPSNGIYSDGFWYIRKVNSNRFPIGTIQQDSFKISSTNQVLVLSGTLRDYDGDNVTVSASIAGVNKEKVISGTASGANWTLQWTASDLPEGEYSSIPILFTDQVGNSNSYLYVGRIAIDFTPPTKPVISTDADGWTNENILVQIAGGEDKNLLSKTYSVDESSEKGYQEAFLITEEGDHTIQAKATDTFGHTTSADPKKAQIVKTPPTKPSLIVSNLGWSREDITFGVSGSTSIAPITYEYQIDNEEFQTGTTSLVNQNGVHTIRARAVDAAGNVSDEVIASVKVDKEGPIISMTPDGQEWGADAFYVQINASDSLSGVQEGISYSISPSAEMPEGWKTVPDSGTVEIKEDGAWYLHVKATDQAGNQTVKTSRVYQLQRAPQAPQMVIAKAQNDREIRVEWSAPDVSFTDGYHYIIENLKTGSKFEVGYPETFVLDTGLQAGTDYAYRVTVQNHTGSAEAAAAALTYPAAPVNIQSVPVSLSGADVVVGFDPVPSATAYRLTVRSQAGEVVYDEKLSETSRVVTGLQPGHVYSVEVAAINATGEGAAASSSFLTLPATPGDFNAIRINERSIELGWLEMQSATNYNLYRVHPDDGKIWSGNETVHLDSELESGTDYAYQVSAENETGEGEPSEIREVRTLPARDDSLILPAATADSITADWSGVTGAEEYELKLLKEGELKQSVTQDVYGYTFTGLEPGTTYTVSLTPLNRSGRGESNQKTITTIPAQPEAIVTAMVEETRATIEIPVTAGATKYKIVLDGQEYITSASTFMIEDLKGSRHYQLQLQAGNAAGYSEPQTFEFITLPVAPSEFIVEEAGENTLELNWTEDPTASEYVIRIFNQNQTVDRKERSSKPGIVMTDLQPGTDYTVSIQAVNPTGEGAISTLDWTTLTEAPKLLEVSTETHEAELTLSEPDGAQSYEVVTSNGMVYKGAGALATLKDLEDAKAYELKVYALNVRGQRSAALPVSIVTKAGEVPGIRISDVTRGSITIQTPETNKQIDAFVIKRDNEEIGEIQPGQSWIDSKLKSNTTYKYEVITKNAAGIGWKQEFIVKTPTPGVLADSLIVTPGTTEASVEFGEVEGATLYKILDETGKSIWEGETTPAKINDLKPGSQHHFEIRVENGSGYESEGLGIDVLLLPSAPEEKEIRVDSTPSSVKLTFVGGKSAYAVYEKEKKIGEVKLGGTELTIAPLQASKDYEFIVFAVNNSGKSEEGLKLKVRTSDAPPSPVYILSTEPVKTEQSEEKTEGQETRQEPVKSAFVDIERSFAKQEITVLAEQGILKGVSEKKFEPNREITRMEFAALLVRSLKVDPNESMQLSFTDIKRSAWYESELRAAVANGIAKGFNEKEFGPDYAINREQAAKMLVNASGSVDQIETRTIALLFEDNGQIASWAEDAVKKAVSDGLVNGYPDGSFRPKANLTRAEAATLVYRLQENQNLTGLEKN